MNNKCDNLEWVTRSENIRHGFSSGLYSAVSSKVRLVDEHGYYIDFNSMSEASRYLGKSHGYVSECLNKKQEFLFDMFGYPFKVEIEQK